MIIKHLLNNLLILYHIIQKKNMSDAIVNPQQERLPHPQEWGPHVWYTMDIFVKGYGSHPDRALRHAASQFFQSLGELLPCPHCREHYKSLLQKKPVHTALKNSEALKKWVAWVKSEVEEVVKQKMIEEYKAHEMEHGSAMNKDLSTRENNSHTHVVPIAPGATSAQMGVRKPPAPTRKRNLGKPRSIPRTHLTNNNPTISKAAPMGPRPPAQKKALSVATASKGAPTAKKGGLNYNQQTAAKIAANWKGSQAGLQRYIKSERGYRRPCACS